MARKSMILKNASVFGGDFEPARADIAVSGGKIECVAPNLSGDESIDLSGCTVVPGFVDVHIHGCAGADTCDATREAVSAMAAYLIRQGVTSFCPTTMTVPPEQISAALAAVKDCMDNPPEGASVAGVNMEGPYISPDRAGAQRSDCVRRPDAREFRKFFDDCGGIVRLVEIAPEREGAREFIEQASQWCHVSLAHTASDYEQAKAAFSWGVSHVTHLFNAMNGLHHRKPGAVGAVFDDDKVRAELICDGFHIHPAVLRTAFRLLGEERTVVVSDSMRAAGMPDGVSELGGQTVYIQNGQARLKDGTIAGSTTNLFDEFKNLVRFGVPFRQALRSVTINPAAAIGLEARIGSIAPGKDADLLALDENLNLRLVMAKGCVR